MKDMYSKDLKRLLPYGSVSAIAKKLGVSTSAVSQALRDGRPNHPAVQEAIRIAHASGALATAQALISLSAK